VLTKVVNGKLVITFLKETKTDVNSEPTINVTMPALVAFNVEGAGMPDLRNINGDSVDIGFQGAGRLVASGKVRQLKLNAQGIGDVDTKALLAQYANLQLEGIGAVKVYASQQLDAVVQGMGSLNDYGKRGWYTKKWKASGPSRPATDRPPPQDVDPPR